MNIVDLSNKIISNSEIYAEIMSATSTLLKYSKNAIEHRRYINNRIALSVQKDFNFGYFPPDKDLNELFEYIDKGKLKQLDILYDKRIDDNGIDKYISSSVFNNHNIILPYKNNFGDIIAVVGRTLLSTEEQSKNNISKYKNTSFQKGLHLFGLNKAKQSIIEKNHVIIVEGQFDCISCNIKGFKNVVAVGSANLSKYQFSLLKRYTNNIYMLFDNDNAGNIGCEKVVNRFGGDANIQKIILPYEYKDVDEFLNNEIDYEVLIF